MTELIKNGTAINEATASTPEPIIRAWMDPGPTGTLLFQDDRGWDEADSVGSQRRPAARGGSARTVGGRRIRRRACGQRAMD